MSTPENTQPCVMLPRWPLSGECGQPATLGWPSEVNGQLVPICDECIRQFGVERKNMSRLPHQEDT